MEVDVKLVVVIGAGFSGLACARELQRRDARLKVQVLEARDRIGGRVHTVAFGPQGCPIDAGASWIHGAGEKNPLVREAEEGNVVTMVCPEDHNAMHDGGVMLGEEEQKKIWLDFVALVEKAQEEEEDDDDDDDEDDDDDDDEDESLASGIMRVTGGRWCQESEVGRRERFARVAHEVLMATSLDKLSLSWGDDVNVYDGDDVYFPNGFVQLIQHVAKDVNVRLKCVVECVEIKKKKGKKKKEDDIVESDDDGDVVVLTLEGGEQITCDHVVVSVPLGVLQRGRLRIPQMPRDHFQSIQRLAMGTLNKVALLFPEAFWEKGQRFVWNFRIPSSATESSFVEFLNGHRFSGYPILIALTGGDHALSFSRRSDEDIVNEMMSALSDMFGHAIPRPLHAMVTRWQEDPYALGSYMYVPVGASDADIEQLVKPIGNKIFFAGEHTSRLHAGYTHGAYLTGLRAANQILDFFGKY